MAAGEFTRDALLRGRVTLLQPARGFRSSLDPLLLTAFIDPPFGRFLDIGCGTGAVSFLLLAKDAAAQGVGVEIQPRLAALAAHGSRDNGFEGRFRLVEGDARTALAGAEENAFDLVATNPPFHTVGTGVLPADEERRVAHHEVALTLADWIDAAHRVLRPEGRLVAVFPADRIADLLAGLVARGFAATRLRFVHPEPGAPAQRILVEARRGAIRPATVLPPLVVHEGGKFSAEVARIVGD